MLFLEAATPVILRSAQRIDQSRKGELAAKRAKNTDAAATRLTLSPALLAALTHSLLTSLDGPSGNPSRKNKIVLYAGRINQSKKQKNDLFARRSLCRLQLLFPLMARAC